MFSEDKKKIEKWVKEVCTVLFVCCIICNVVCVHTIHVCVYCVSNSEVHLIMFCRWHILRATLVKNVAEEIWKVNC